MKFTGNLKGVSKTTNSLGDQVDEINQSEYGVRMQLIKKATQMKVSELLALQGKGSFALLANDWNTQEKETLPEQKNCLDMVEYLGAVEKYFNTRFGTLKVSRLEHRIGGGIITAKKQEAINNEGNQIQLGIGERMDTRVYPGLKNDQLEFGKLVVNDKIDEVGKGEQVAYYSFSIPSSREGMEAEIVYIEFEKQTDNIQSADEVIQENAFKGEVLELRNYLENKGSGAIIEESSMKIKEKYTDQSTGLYNATYLKEKLNNPQHDYSIIFIDISAFKKINDTYGQNFGDAVINEVAKFLVEYSGPDDKVCRNGGDEFVIMLNNRGKKSSEVQAQIQRFIENKLQLHAQKLTLNNDAKYNNTMPLDDIVPIDLVFAQAISTQDIHLLTDELIGEANKLLKELKDPEGEAYRIYSGFDSAKRLAKKISVAKLTSHELYNDEYLTLLSEDQQKLMKLISEMNKLFFEEGNKRLSLEVNQKYKDFVARVDAIYQAGLKNKS